MSKYKPKIRIQLLTENGEVLSDRLVDSYTELLEGPKDIHKGPFRIEITIDSEDTYTKFKSYLEKVKGFIPLNYKPRKSSSNATTKNPYKEIYLACKNKETQEDLIDYLQGLGFKFVTYQFLEEKIQDKKFNLGDVNFDIFKETQWLVRLIKEAKDPANDKYDFNLMFGIKILGKKKKKVLVFYKGSIKNRLIIKWKSTNAINMKVKKKPMIFPKYMTIEERKKWRIVDEKIRRGKIVGPKDTQFYERYKLDINNLNLQK